MGSSVDPAISVSLWQTACRSTQRLISTLWDDTVGYTSIGEVHREIHGYELPAIVGDGRAAAIGTVEFRGGRPMTTMEDLLTQANILLSIKKFVREFEGTEEQMLVRLNDGVYNTVLASGVGAGISVPQSDLEDAMIHLMDAPQIIPKWHGEQTKEDTTTGHLYWWNQLC